MPRGSSDSARIIWLDRQGVLAQLRRAVSELATAHPEIERVLLFGSLARGEAVPGSDADLLIVLTGSELSFLDRIPQYTPTGCAIGVEAFPYTRCELEKMVAEGNHLIKRALAEGLELFRRESKDG